MLCRCHSGSQTSGRRAPRREAGLMAAIAFLTAGPHASVCVCVCTCVCLCVSLCRDNAGKNAFFFFPNSVMHQK